VTRHEAGSPVVHAEAVPVLGAVRRRSRNGVVVFADLARCLMRIQFRMRPRAAKGAPCNDLIEPLSTCQSGWGSGLANVGKAVDSIMNSVAL
jgi:hypothetical protein